MTGSDDLLTLPLALGAHLSDERRALLLRLLAQARGLVAGVGQLCPVVREHLLGLGLRRLGVVNTAFDQRPALFQNLVDVREELLRQDAKDDEESDQADDQLWNRRDQGF